MITTPVSRNNLYCYSWIKVGMSLRKAAAFLNFSLWVCRVPSICRIFNQRYFYKPGGGWLCTNEWNYTEVNMFILTLGLKSGISCWLQPMSDDGFSYRLCYFTTSPEKNSWMGVGIKSSVRKSLYGSQPFNPSYWFRECQSTKSTLKLYTSIHHIYKWMLFHF